MTQVIRDDALLAEIDTNVVHREENDRLYPLVVSGDKNAIKKMIEMNMSFVIFRVDLYIQCYPSVKYLRDDLISEGFLGLTIAVNRMAELGPIDDPKPTRYIQHWVTKSIGIVVDAENGMGASPATQRRYRERGDTLPQLVSSSAVMNDLETDPRSMSELRDLLSACCQTDEDRMIIDMREKRYSDKEIAAAIGMPVSSAYMMRRDIYARFLAKSGMKGEV